MPHAAGSQLAQFCTRRGPVDRAELAQRFIAAANDLCDAGGQLKLGARLRRITVRLPQ